MNTMSEMFPPIKEFTEKRIQCLKDEKVVQSIIQEKLDGCNFRCILNADGKITFGTRKINLKDEKDFHGFSRIKKQLLDSTLSLKKLVKQQDCDSMDLTVFGDLIGRDASGHLFVPRIDYLKDDSIAYYAYEILINRKAYNGPSEDLYVYSSTHDPGALTIGKYAFLNFELAQKKLKEAGFNVIPYEVEKFDNKTVGQIVVPPFKSLLFNHSHQNEIEGYVLRYKLRDGRWFCFKYKSEKFSGLKSLHRSVINEDSWIDFMSKYNYGAVTNENAEEILIQFANDLELEKNKKNFTALQRFIGTKIPKVKGQKLSIYSGKALENFLRSENTD